MPFSTDDPNAQELLARNAQFDAPNPLQFASQTPPQLQGPNLPVPQLVQPQQQAQKPGGIKGMFAGMLAGMADAAMKESTGMNSVERQMAQLEMQQKRQQLQYGPMEMQAKINAMTAQPRFDPSSGQFVGVMNDAQYQQYVRGQGAARTNATSHENVAGITQAGANQRSAATNATNLSIADKRLESMRELTKLRMQTSQQIASNHDATTMSAAQLRSRIPFVKEGMKSYDFALDADNRFEQMQQQASSPNPAGDKALLFNHIAMTLGAVKGGRVTQAEIESHLKARDLGSEIMQAWDRTTTGKSLTPEQRSNFIKLASEVRNAAWDRAYRRADYYGVIDSPEDNPSLPQAQTAVRRPSAGSAPPPGSKVRDFSHLVK